MRCTSCLILIALLAACSGESEDRLPVDPLASDPVVARALHDPLMSDPDLASRNEANALLGFAGDTGLPMLPATPESARAAREAARIELLVSGDIVPLPAASADGGPVVAADATAEDLLAVMRAPERCSDAIKEGFVWAVDPPPVAAIMPHGMVVQAAGARSAPCDLRIIRYRTPAAPDDVLQYHLTRAVRAGLRPVVYADPAASLSALGENGEALSVHVRHSASGMTAVDLLYRAP
ncbi:hypothetical protein [Erythrobacter sp.]|uniref:hypothetical protein n=1 Tax=Erythrobacter sp. TaxID=1042 RepID=UPI0025CFBB17|nr:hypothetical protein [Erythrobacter sp.]